MDAVLDQNGDLVLCGEYFNTANNNDILVMKYSSNGGFLWMDTINGVGALFDQGKGVCVALYPFTFYNKLFFEKKLLFYKFYGFS